MFQRSLGLLAVTAAFLVLGGCVAKSNYLRKQAEADALNRDVATLTTENYTIPAILSAAAFGEYRPVAENDTPEGRAKNRRIAIILLPKE